MTLRWCDKFTGAMKTLADTVDTDCCGVIGGPPLSP